MFVVILFIDQLVFIAKKCIIITDMTLKRKLLRIFINTTKIVLAVGMLYLFVCSLDLLSSSFRLIAGKTAGTQ